MPLVSKRRREPEEEVRKDQVKRRRKCKEFTEFENIGYRCDHWHSVFRSIPESIDKLKYVLSKYIGSFLNGDGGILCFGVRKTGVIYGDEISRREEDNIRLLIDDTFKKMHPHVPTDGYRVTFTPVLGSAYRRRDGVKEATKLHVLEVRVAPGDPFSLYEDQNHEVFLRKTDEPYGPLTPHEIKRHTVQQLRNQLKSQKDMAKLFESPQQSGKGAKDKENRVVKIKGVKLTSTTSSSVKSNQSSPQKQSSKTSTRHILRYSLRSNSAKKSQTKSNPSSPSKHSSSRQSSQSPSKSPPPKPTSSSQVVSGPGSCKECPFVLSSGESDHEVPLPPLETKQKPKVNSVTSIGKELPAKPTIQPFQLKKERGPFVSTVNQLTAKGKGLAKVVPSETPPTAPLTAQQQPAKKTTKVLPAQEKSKNDPKTSQQKNPSQLPAHMPVLKAAGNPAKRAPAACILPPPPPPPPHYSYPYNPYAQCPPRYGHPQPMPPPFQHHTGPYHSGYHPQYTFSGSGLPSARYGGYISRGSGLPYSRSAHPLTTHYSATY